MTSSECLHVAAQLDEHHTPETNGRIPVCHTCGARTEGPSGGHHVLQEDRVNRSTEWLGRRRQADPGYRPLADTGGH